MSPVLNPTIEADFIFAHKPPFRLSSGESLEHVTLRYAVYGKLSPQKDNAILVCHALSGSARVADWWPELFGADRAFDITHHCVIGINVLGSCYGSTGPLTVEPSTGRPYGARFPLVTVSDMVKAQAQLFDFLGVKVLRAVVGGSIGGMQALRWAVDFPERVERCIAIGAAPLSAMGLAFNHLQRQAIRNDRAWLAGEYQVDQQPVAGMALARAIAVCSYKSPELFAERFGRHPDRSGEDPSSALAARYDVAGYLDYQGQSFAKRFDANTFLILSKAMDTFDLARGHQSTEAALRRIQARVLLVGISSDWLFPAADIITLKEAMRTQGVDAEYQELCSSHGHDGFLADSAALARLLRPSLADSTDLIPRGVSVCEQPADEGGGAGQSVGA